MNSDRPKTPREELEASLTALLLGELPAEKAAALRELMGKDAELAKLYGRLEQAIGLVRETTAADPQEETVVEPPQPKLNELNRLKELNEEGKKTVETRGTWKRGEGLKMSGKKRERLLAHFKTVAPKEFEKPKRPEFRVREVAVAAGIVACIGVAAALLFPTQRAFRSASNFSQGDNPELWYRKAGKPSPVASVAEQTTARLAAENALEQEQHQVVAITGSAGGGSGRDGTPWQTVFNKENAKVRRDVAVSPSAGKPVSSEIVLPKATATDFAVSGTQRGFYDDSLSTSKPGDPEWIGALERGNYSATAHSSTNAFVSRFAGTVVQTNSSATASPGFAYYSDLNRGFDTNGPLVASADDLDRRLQVSGQFPGGTDQEVYRRRYGGAGWSNNTHSKQGDVGLAEGAVQQMSRSKVQEALRNSSENKSMETNMIIDPTTGLPVATSEAFGIAVNPATGLPIPAAAPEIAAAPAKALAWNGSADTNAFFTPEELLGRKPAQTLTVGGGTGGGGDGGGAGPVTLTGIEPMPTIAPPSLNEVPAQTPAATTPVAREKLAELADRKDASGSNIYLGTELAKANAKSRHWGLEPGGLATGTKKEQEPLKQMGEIAAGNTIAGRQLASQNGFESFDQSIPLGGSFTNAIVGITGQDSDQVNMWNVSPQDIHGWDNTSVKLNPGAGFFYVGDTNNIKNTWVRTFDDGATRQVPLPEAAVVTPTPQVPSNVYSLNVVGYVDLPRSASNKFFRITTNRIEGNHQPALRPNIANVGDVPKVADAVSADSPTMLMSAETLRKLEGMRIELEAQLMQQETQVDALKKMPREKLVAALPTASSDKVISDLQAQKTLTEKELLTKQRELSESSPEVAKIRSRVSDLESKISQQADGIVSNLDTRLAYSKEQLGRLRGEVEKAKTNKMAYANENEPYWEAKRKLDDLERFNQALMTKVMAENIEASLPKTTMVEIMDDATPAKSANASLWDRLRGKGKFESDARIKIERDQTDVAFATDATKGAAYDPYFIQNEFEVIQSDRVLSNVVAALNLQKEWGRNGRNLSANEAVALLKERLDLKPERSTGFVDIRARSDKAEEAAKLANAVAKAYQGYRHEVAQQLSLNGIAALEERLKEQQAKVDEARKEVDRLRATETAVNETKAAADQPVTNQVDIAPAKPATPPPLPQPEVQTRENSFSTFSMNVSDVAFKLAAASLEKGQMPEAGNIRSEEFINAFDYRDPEAVLPARGKTGVPVAFAWERARYPYAQNRDLLRFSIKTGAQGRQAGRPMNLVLLLDNSGSMERADRVAIIREALKVLASQLQPQDKLSVITFARTAQLRVDGVAGNQAAQVAEEIGGLTPEGGTNIEEAMNLAYQTALRHYLANGINRVVLLTDGAANLGNVEPEVLKQKVEANRKQGIALDCFGIGWEGFNDDLLETLSRNGDGRYGFINTPEEATTEFAGQLAGALNVAASDVKVQVEFNPARVTAYRQIGYAKHQLTKEQFRDNTVDAAEIAAQEAGNALYVVEVNPAGQGPLGTVRVRFKVPGTSDYREHEWTVPFNGNAVALEQASPAMRLAATASAFSEWLASSPYATEVTPDTLLRYLGGVPEVYGADARPKKLEWMIRQAKSLNR